MYFRVDMGNNRLISFLIIFLVFALIFGLNLNFKANNYDVFFHIKTGEYIAQNKEIPNNDIFSHTSDNEWTVHEYVPAMMFYFFYKNFGFDSLIFLKAAVITLIFLLLFKLFNKNLYVSLALTVFAALSTSIYAYIRPHIFFWLFLVLIFVILKYKKYYLLPLLTLIWANFHSSVIIGVAIVSIYLLDLFIVKKQLKFIYLIIACFITSLINPHTYKIFLLPLKILKLSADVNEWKPYGIESFWFWFYLIFTACIVLIFILSNKKIKITYLLVFVLFTVLAFKSKRYVASSILVNLIIIQPYLSRLKIKRSKAKDYFFIILALLLIVFSVVKLNAFNTEIPWRHFGENAIDFVKNNNIEGNMYNSYELGGPIIFKLYPEYKVFIDGRIDVYGKEIVDDYYDIRYGENLKDLIEKYNISFFIIDNKLAADIGPILLKDDNYKLVFFDEYFSVYVEDIAEYKNIRKFTAINPYYGLDPKQNTEMIINEIEYLLSIDPDNINAYRNLGLLYYFEKNDKEKAMYYFDKYLEINPNDKEIKELVK